MSGGIFDYQQDKIRKIARSVRDHIYLALKPKPKKVHLDYWTSVLYEHYPKQRSTAYISESYRKFKTREEALKYIEEEKEYTRVKDLSKLPVTLSEGGVAFEYRPLCQSSSKDSKDSEVILYNTVSHFVKDEYPYDVFELTEDSIQFLKEGYKILRLAEIYAQRIDWMLSGDDGEDTMLERFKTDVEKWEKELSEIDWSEPEEEDYI